MADELQQPEATPTPSPEPSSPTHAQYEFNAEENQVFALASVNLRVGGWGIIVLVITYHTILLGRWAFGGPPMYQRFQAVHIWLPLLLIVGSGALIRAGRAFNRVVHTQGSDITHLMDGLRSLNEVFGWLPMTWVVILLAIAVGGLAAAVHVFGF